MKIKKYNKLLLASLFSGILFTGCGGGGGGGSSTTSGNIIKGILVNAKVCIDQNENNTCDNDEPYDITDINGYYSISGTYDSPILVESNSSSLDKSTGKPFIGFMYASTSTGSVNNVTMFTTLEKIMSDNNITDVNLSKIFNIDGNYLNQNFITSNELNSSEKDKLEKASQFVKQFITTTIEDINDSNVSISISNPNDYYTITKSFVDSLSSKNNPDLSNIDSNTSLTKDIKKSIAQNASNTLNFVSKMSDINSTIENNTTSFESVDSVSNELETLLKSMYAVPVLESNGTISNLMNHQLHDFNITSYKEQLTDSNITITGMIDNSNFNVTLVLNKDSGIYGGKIDSTHAFALDLNFKENNMINAGMVLSFAEDTNSDNKVDSISYWGLSTKENICKEYNNTVGLNSLNNFYTIDISCN